MNKTYLHSVFDQYVDWLNSLGGLNELLTEIPTEMLDRIDPNSPDWGFWKPIPSILMDADFARVENHLNLPLPSIFKDFLTYRHFVNFQMGDIMLFDNKPSWSFDYLRKVEEYGLVIEGNSLVPFGEVVDIGLVCFDLRFGEQLIWLNREDGYSYHGKQVLANSLGQLFRQFENNLFDWKNNLSK